MSRSGYSDWDDYDEGANWAMIRWRGAVASATKGARGQTLLREMLAALDAMPTKELIAHDIETETGAVCALGALGKARGMEMQVIDPECPEQVAGSFNAAPALVKEIVYENDECGGYHETPHQRWCRMRAWVAGQVKEQTGAES